MNKEKFLKIITYMGIVYNKEFSKEQISVWYSFLKDYSEEELNNAVKYLINTEKHLPTIAHIKEQIAKNKMSSLPEAEDEWQKVLLSVRQYGSYRQIEALKSLSPYTAKVVNYIGYYKICNASSEEQTWNKKEFIAEYNALKDKQIIELQIENKKVNLLDG